VGIAPFDGTAGTFSQMQHCGEHNRGSGGDTAFCSQLSFRSFPFVAGKYPENNPDGATATLCRIEASAFGGIPCSRRLSVVLCGENPE